MPEKKHLSVVSIICAILILLAAAFSGCANGEASKAVGDNHGAQPPRDMSASLYGYRIINTFPHDRENFTQGLDMQDGVLYEGTGQNGQSRLLKTDLRSGDIIESLDLDPQYFGEGITVLGEDVYQLTYTSRIGFVYGKDSFALSETFSYDTEGWGLTDNGRELILGDGSSVLRFMDPATMRETRSIAVSDDKGPVSNLNELEYIDGEIYANVWKTDRIAIISAETGKVTGWIDLAGLNPDPTNLEYPYVLNGIAYDPESAHLLVTGKCWPEIFEIELVPQNPTGS
jgi:glutamine cyclotransferase